MATCSFCGHANADDARSCVACGHVFAPEEGGPCPAGTGGGDGGAGAGHLVTLYDPAPAEKLARQVAIMAAVAGLLALVVAVAAASSTARALDDLDAGAAVFLSAPDVPDVAGRADLLTLAEHSLFAGVLVIFGGWAQAIGANRSLLGAGAVRRDADAMLRAFVVVGPNVVNAGRAVGELWSDNAPPGREGEAPPPAVRWFGAVFGAAVVTRIASIVWGYLFAPAPTTEAKALVAGVVVAGTRLVWIVTLAAGVVATRAVSARQRDRAAALTED